MNAITVSLSTPPTTSLPLSPTKKRPTGHAPPVLAKASRKLSLKGCFADVAIKTGSTRVVIAGVTAVENGLYSSKDGCVHGRKSLPKEPLSHNSSASYSSSFACPSARKVSYESILMSPEATVDVSIPRLAARDSKLDEDEDGEPGYAYIYTDSNAKQDPRPHMDPLNVGHPVPFRSHQHFSVQVRICVSSDIPL